MSSLIVEICTIEKILPHENADRLEIAKVKGWHCVVPVGKFISGDLCVYFPPDSILPGPLARHLKADTYLKPLPKDAYGERPDAGRVGVARLRGVPSYGLIEPVIGTVPDGLVPHVLGTDVADILGVTKYEPPEPTIDGETEKENAFFHQYTHIENINNFPYAFVEDELVTFTEKIHGKNVRLGSILVDDERILMAGSHRVPRKEFHSQNNLRSEYWKCFDTPGVKDLLDELVAKTDGQVIIFGELYGCGVQDMWYGHAANKTSFAVFDITVNGVYLNHSDLIDACKLHKVQRVPVVYTGPFKPERVNIYTNAERTTLCSPEIAGKYKGREGIVIRPFVETRMGQRRKILKSISFEYLNRKGGTEFN